MVVVFLSLLLSFSQAKEWHNFCLEPHIVWNPNAGVPTVQNFCGPQDETKIEDRVPFTMTVDGLAVNTTDAWLTKMNYFIYGVIAPANGYSSFITSREYAVSKGTHTVKITYSGRVVTFTVIGV